MSEWWPDTGHLDDYPDDYLDEYRGDHQNALSVLSGWFISHILLFNFSHQFDSVWSNDSKVFHILVYKQNHSSWTATGRSLLNALKIHQILTEWSRKFNCTHDWPEVLVLTLGPTLGFKTLAEERKCIQFDYWSNRHMHLIRFTFSFQYQTKLNSCSSGRSALRCAYWISHC